MRYAYCTLRGLAKMPLVRRGNRLSVMPVPTDAWQVILEMAQQPVA